MKDKPHHTIPGLERHPALLAEFNSALFQLRYRSGGCSACQKNSLIRQYKAKLIAADRSGHR